MTTIAQDNVMVNSIVIEVVALLEQPRGPEGISVYTLWTEDERGKQKSQEIDGFKFSRILELAGEPTYREPGYWTYDNTPISWDDVMPEGRGA
jgi:hypothetical protein